MLQTINVAYSTSDSYAWLTGVSMTSLLQNNKDCQISFYILCNKVKEENKEIIRKIAIEFNAEISFFDLDVRIDLFKKFNLQKKWDFATFGRLFEAELLPNEVDRVIHIDCDTIINGSIKDVYNIPLSNKALAGVKECLSSNYQSNINVEKERDLLNAGVLIFNLEYIRDNNIVKKFVDCINEHDKLEYLDQDVLNITIKNDEKSILPLKYNSYSVLHYFTYKQLMRLRRPTSFYDEKEFKEAIETPVIIHFTTCRYDYGRPWNYENKHPFKKKFIEVKDSSLFSSHELLHVKKSIKTLFVRLMPKGLSCWISYFLNQIVRPRLRKAK